MSEADLAEKSVSVVQKICNKLVSTCQSSSSRSVDGLRTDGGQLGPGLMLGVVTAVVSRWSSSGTSDMLSVFSFTESRDQRHDGYFGELTQGRTFEFRLCRATLFI